MRYLDIIWLVFCTEIVIFFGLGIIAFAWSFYDCVMRPDIDFDKYGNKLEKVSSDSKKD